MRELRVGLILISACALLALGCDDGRDDEDAGGVDSGTTPMDAGPGTDSGSSTGDDGGPGTDSGGSSDMCGNPGDCDVLAQDCGAGMACRNLVMSAGDTPMGLCEMAGTKGEGEACSRDSGPECAEGLICFEGACREYCCDGRATDCSELGHYCQRFTDTIVGLCLPSSGCSLVDQTGCESGQGCYPLPDGVTRCSMPAPDAGEPGDSCASLQGCNPGSGCIGDPGVCREFCDPTATDPCPTDFMCAGLTGHDGTGVCVPADGG